MRILTRLIKNYKKARRFTKGKVSGVPLDGFVSYYFNRRVSALFTALLIDTKVTPNQITIFTFTLGVLTCVPLYLSGNFFLAGVMVWVITILDCVDGEIARAKGLVTKRGRFTDSFLDRLFEISLIFSIALSVSLTSQSIIPWVFGNIAFLGIFLENYTVELYGNRVGNNSLDKVRIKITKKVGFWPARDVFLFIITIASFINAPEKGLFIAGLLSCTFSLSRILIALKIKPG